MNGHRWRSDRVQPRRAWAAWYTREMRTLVICAGCALLLGCSSPSGDDAEVDAGVADATADASGPGQARWTFLVFMNGDNDLEELVFKDLNELEAVGSGNGVHVLVQADRAEGYYEGDGDWTACRRYYITGDSDPQQVSSQVIQEMGECDMGAPEVLSDFLMWAHAEYPAAQMALMLWDHGDSWTVRSEPDNPVSGFISWDEESNNELSIAEGELRAALAPVVSARGPLEVVGFDACNMASWEVAHSLRDQALTMSGSEATVDIEGFMYGPALALLRDEEVGADPSALAIELASGAVTLGGEWTFSAVDLSEMDGLAAAVDELAGAVLDNAALMPALLQARDDAGGADATWHDWYLDLYDLGRVLVEGGDSVLGPAGQGVMDAMDDAILGAWGSSPYEWTGGLTIYFDPTAGYTEPYCNGAGATWSQATRWDELLLEVGPR